MAAPKGKVLLFWNRSGSPLDFLRQVRGLAQEVAATSVNKELFAELATLPVRTVSPEEVGQHFYQVKVDWAPFYPAQQRHAKQFDQIMGPWLDLKGFRFFHGVDLYYQGDYNQAYHIGYNFLSLIDIARALLEAERPNIVVCVSEDNGEANYLPYVLRDLAAQLNFNLVAVPKLPA